MNSSQPQYQAPPSSGRGMVTIFIVVIVLVLLGVGGYFAYTKWWVPRQCNNRGPDSTSNVASFVWDSDSSSCLANVCMDGFGSAAKGGLPVAGNCFTYSITYKTLGTGNCTSDSTGTIVSTASKTSITSSTDDCASACNADSGCKGYDWNSGTPTVCNLYSTTPAGSNIASSSTTMCYIPK